MKDESIYWITEQEYEEIKYRAAYLEKKSTEVIKQLRRLFRVRPKKW